MEKPLAICVSCDHYDYTKRNIKNSSTDTAVVHNGGQMLTELLVGGMLNGTTRWSAGADRRSSEPHAPCHHGPCTVWWKNRPEATGWPPPAILHPLLELVRLGKHRLTPCPARAMSSVRPSSGRRSSGCKGPTTCRCQQSWLPPSPHTSRG